MVALVRRVMLTGLLRVGVVVVKALMGLLELLVVGALVEQVYQIVLVVLRLLTVGVEEVALAIKILLFQVALVLVVVVTLVVVVARLRLVRAVAGVVVVLVDLGKVLLGLWYRSRVVRAL
jgi:hypothetical protein